MSWFNSPLKAGSTSKLQLAQGFVFETQFMLNSIDTLHSIENINIVVLTNPLIH